MFEWVTEDVPPPRVAVITFLLLPFAVAVLAPVLVVIEMRLLAPRTPFLSPVFLILGELSAGVALSALATSLPQADSAAMKVLFVFAALLYTFVAFGVGFLLSLDAGPAFC